MKIRNIVPLAVLALVLSACASMTQLPDDKLQEAAAAVIGKPVTISNVRHNDDMSYFDAKTADGAQYACSLQVVMGMTSQHQKCDKK